MKCPKCASQLVENAKFCTVCGQRLEGENAELTEGTASTSAVIGDTVETVTPVQQKTFAAKLWDGFLSFWHRIDLFCKIETIAIAITTLLLIAGFITGKIIPIIFSVLQLGGLITALLLHKEKIKTGKKWLKYFILIVSIAFTFLNFSSYSWLKGNIFNSLPADTIVKVDTPCAASDCIGKRKDSVINDFIAAGFTNISEEVVEDLEITQTDKYQTVAYVSINGVSDFTGNTEFKASAKVVIKYHLYKRVNMPISPEEAKNMDTETILNTLENAGFIDIETSEEYDLDPDATTVAYENQILIDGTSSFVKDAKFSPNAKIKVVTHRPYEKYKLKVIVDFVSNLIFSRYDVEFTVGNHKETLTHGNSAEFEYRLKEGKYTLIFESAESSTVYGMVEVNLTGDTEANYKISCHSDKVSVETIYVENKDAVGENEAMIPTSASGCKYKNYKDVEAAFKNAGFTNIKTEILYDIFWGWTEEGEVEKVSVGGKTDFKRGDIFAKDAPVIITYHMKEEDDPDKQKQTKPTTTKPTSGSNVSSSNKIRLPEDDDYYVGKMRDEVEKTFKDMGFKNVVVYEEITEDPSCINNEVTIVTVGSSAFREGDEFDEGEKVVIYYWKVQKPDLTNVVLPLKSSKLGKDYDSTGKRGVHYLNTDGYFNEPELTKWGTETITDGVAEYLSYLQDLGFSIEVTDSTHREPYSGYHTYETDFKVSNEYVSWTMSLYIQDERYVEYQFDINLE